MKMHSATVRGLATTDDGHPFTKDIPCVRYSVSSPSGTFSDARLHWSLEASAGISLMPSCSKPSAMY